MRPKSTVPPGVPCGEKSDGEAKSEVQTEKTPGEKMPTQGLVGKSWIGKTQRFKKLHFKQKNLDTAKIEPLK